MRAVRDERVAGGLAAGGQLLAEPDRRHPSGDRGVRLVVADEVVDVLADHQGGGVERVAVAVHATEQREVPPVLLVGGTGAVGDGVGHQLAQPGRRGRGRLVEQVAQPRRGPGGPARLAHRQAGGAQPAEPVLLVVKVLHGHPSGRLRRGPLPRGVVLDAGQARRDDQVGGGVMGGGEVPAERRGVHAGGAQGDDDIGEHDGGVVVVVDAEADVALVVLEQVGELAERLGEAPGEQPQLTEDGAALTEDVPAGGRGSGGARVRWLRRRTASAATWAASDG